MSNLRKKILEVFSENDDHHYISSYIPRTDLGTMVDPKYGYSSFELAVKWMKKLLKKEYWRGSKEFYIDEYRGPDKVSTVAVPQAEMN
jgi:hypothetical protein